MGQHILSANCVNTVLLPISFNQLLKFIIFNCHVSVFVTCILCVLQSFFGEGEAEQHEYVNISGMTNCNFNY
jgi:hypothetical protein